MVLDGDGRITYLNPTFYALFGYAPDEILGQDISVLAVPDQSSQFQPESILSQLRKQDRWKGEVQRRARDGTPIPILLGSAVVRDEHGSVTGYVGTYLDLRPIKRAQAALAENEAKFHALAEGAQDAVIMLDERGMIVYWNPAASRMFGHAEKDALGKDMHELLVPIRYRESAHQGYAAFAKTGRGSIVGTTRELEALRRDGTEFPIELSVSAVRLGGRIHAVGFLRDITARRQAAERIRELARFPAENPYPVLRVDSDGRVRFANPATSDLLGIAADGKEEQVPDDWRDAVVQALRTDEIGSLEVERAGRVYLIAVAPVAEGNYANLYCIDITERRQAQDALLRSEEKFRGLVENSNDLIWEVDGAGMYTYVSPHIEAMLGYRPDEVIGKSPFDLMSREESRRARAALQDAVDTKQPILGFENVNLHRDGREVAVETNATPIIDAEGRLSGFLGIDRDITERKRTEKALRRLNRALLALSSGNQALVHATDETTLLQGICDLLVETGGYQLAWIAYPEHQGSNTLRIVAQASKGSGISPSTVIPFADDATGQHPAGRAMRSGQPQVIEDIATEPLLGPWREEMIAAGLASGIALPLVSDGQLLGLLHVFSTLPSAFAKEELELLEELAGDAAFGVLTLRTRAEHDRLQKEALRHTERLRQVLSDTIRAIALTVEKRDPYTAGHQLRVADLAAAIAEELGLDADHVDGIRLGATIHDIGKIYVPAEILNRPGKLDKFEMDMIKSHPEVGYDIIKDVKFPWPVAQMILQHHERLDGSGYPHGLRGNDIILEARILAAADVVEAITAHRPYRAGRGLEVALEEIRQHRGTLYDPGVVDACLALFHSRRFEFDTAAGSDAAHL